MNDELKELAQSIAKDIFPILLQIDILCITYKIDDLKKILDNMQKHVSLLEAMPFPETMRKAEVLGAQTQTFAAFVQLIEIRRSQLETQRKPDTTPGAEILKAMGLN
jgi:hypothetical protein